MIVGVSHLHPDQNFTLASRFSNMESSREISFSEKSSHVKILQFSMKYEELFIIYNHISNEILNKFIVLLFTEN